MATTQTNDFDVTDEDQLDDRDVRALIECMTTLPTDSPGIYEVTSESGSEYTVDARGGSCSCPDAMHRDICCKHIRRARFAIGRKEIPQWVNLDVVDPQLGDHVDHHPVVADGGRLRTRQDQFDTERVDGGVLVWKSEGLGRRLAGFTQVEDWDAVRSELARRGMGVGAVHQKPVYEPQEVGL